jgi:hypothetical protein
MRVKKVYIAYDGTQFSNEKDCVEYEKQNNYKELFENYGSKIRFYGNEGQFLQVEELSEYDFDNLDYIYLEDSNLAEITANYIEESIPSPFKDFGNIAGYFWWDYDNEEWHDFAREYNNLIEKNKTGFDLKYLLNLREE